VTDDPSADLPTLHQFLGSHFNEKARWGLDWKCAPHRRVSHLPGPHMLKIRRMTGQTATPVLSRFAEHEAAHSVREQYARHRSASAAV
jgi:hypothetical protein